MATIINTYNERAAYIAGARAAFDGAFVQLDNPGYLAMKDWIDHDLRDWTRGTPPDCPELRQRGGDRALAALELRYASRERWGLRALLGVVGIAVAVMATFGWMLR